MVTGFFYAGASAMTASIPPSSVARDERNNESFAAEHTSLAWAALWVCQKPHVGAVQVWSDSKAALGIFFEQSSSSSQKDLAEIAGHVGAAVAPRISIFGHVCGLVVILGSLFWGIDSSPTGQFNPTVGACTPQFLPIGGLPCICTMVRCRSLCPPQHLSVNDVGVFLSFFMVKSLTHRVFKTSTDRVSSGGHLVSLRSMPSQRSPFAGQRVFSPSFVPPTVMWCSFRKRGDC